MKPRVKRNRRRGNSIVEFAISLPFLVAVVAGVFQFGYTFFIYNSLRNSVHAGARFASAADYEIGTSTFENQVKNVVVYGTPAPSPGSPTLVPGLTTSQVAVSSNAVDGIGIPRSITVSISGYEVPSVWRPTRLEGKPQATFPYMGQFIGD
jgi:hypothetical protein